MNPVIYLSEYLKYVVNVTTTLHHVLLIVHVIVIIFFFHNFPVDLLSSFWELWNALVSLEFGLL